MNKIKKILACVTAMIKVIFYPYYLHTKTNKDLIEVAISLADRGYLEAIYKMTSGSICKVEKEYSGVNKPFTFVFK